MAIRKNREMGFADTMVDGGRRTAALLQRLDDATPWERLAEPIAALPEYTNAGPGRLRGGAAWDPTLMLKCLMLAKWFNLSDPGLEEALMDRVSFRRFVGLSFNDATPDETTFVNFRKRLREAQIHDAIFDSVVEHLDSKGFLVREGTIGDHRAVPRPPARRRHEHTRSRRDLHQEARRHAPRLQGAHRLRSLGHRHRLPPHHGQGARQPAHRRHDDRGTLGGDRRQRIQRPASASRAARTQRRRRHLL